MSEFGTTLKAIRKEKNMTQKMLANNICSQSVLSRIENNEEIPNTIVMVQLCSRLGVSIDQVVKQKLTGIQKNQETLHLMAYYFHERQYGKLKEVLEQEYVEKQLFLDSELQRYFFYKGFCDQEVEHNYDLAIQDLTTSLNYTYSNMKHTISDIEILIISCIGKVYGKVGDNKKAMCYLNKSIELFYSLSLEQFHFELIMIFSTISEVLIQQGEWNRAEELISQGISWAENKYTYYFLDELFLLKSKVLQEKNDQEGMERCLSIYNGLKEISN